MLGSLALTTRPAGRFLHSKDADVLRIAIVSLAATLLATGSLAAQQAAQSSYQAAPQRFRPPQARQPAVRYAPVMAARPRNKISRPATNAATATPVQPSQAKPSLNREPLSLVPQFKVQSADAAAHQGAQPESDPERMTLRSLDVDKLVDGVENAMPRVGKCPKCGQRQFEGIFAQVYRRRASQRKPANSPRPRRLAKAPRR